MADELQPLKERFESFVQSIKDATHFDFEKGISESFVKFETEIKDKFDALEQRIAALETPALVSHFDEAVKAGLLGEEKVNG